jgi:hypothetical protein
MAIKEFIVPIWDDARAELKAYLEGHKQNELFYGRMTYARMNKVRWRRDIDRMKADLKRGIK